MSISKNRFIELTGGFNIGEHPHLFNLRVDMINKTTKKMSAKEFASFAAYISSDETPCFACNLSVDECTCVASYSDIS